MSDNFDRFRRVAEECGYELAHGQEGYGEHFFGLMILVRMSNRKLITDRDDFRDRRVISKAADDIRRCRPRSTPKPQR